MANKEMHDRGAIEDLLRRITDVAGEDTADEALEWAQNAATVVLQDPQQMVNQAIRWVEEELLSSRRPIRSLVHRVVVMTMRDLDVDPNLVVVGGSPGDLEGTMYDVPGAFHLHEELPQYDLYVMNTSLCLSTILGAVTARLVHWPSASQLAEWRSDDAPSTDNNDKKEG